MVGKIVIRYVYDQGDYCIESNLKYGGIATILGEILRSHLGAGEDHTPRNELDIYTFTLLWYPDNDDIKVSSDCGNKGLETAILGNIFQDFGE